jgi:hypothetical protein
MMSGAHKVVCVDAAPRFSPSALRPTASFQHRWLSRSRCSRHRLKLGPCPPARLPAFASIFISPSPPSPPPPFPSLFLPPGPLPALTLLSPSPPPLPSPRSPPQAPSLSFPIQAMEGTCVAPGNGRDMPVCSRGRARADASARAARGCQPPAHRNPTRSLHSHRPLTHRCLSALLRCLCSRRQDSRRHRTIA